MKLRIAAAMLAVLLLCGCGTPASSGGSGADGGSSVNSSGDSIPDHLLRVYGFSAGKADAFLLTTGSGAVLIDTGESGSGKEIVSYLEKMKIPALDYLILTHFDKDHVGGAAKVLKSISVKQVLQSDEPKDSRAYQKYVSALETAGITPHTVRKTDEFTLDDVVYSVDPPQKTSYASDSSNNSSLIVSVRYGERRFLFAGDAQEARLREFLEENPGSFDFLKVPDHGRWQDILPEFFKTVSPAFAVITSSDDEPEDAATRAALTAAGAKVFLTRTHPVLAQCDGTDLRVQYD
jgi:beta-lactamase superfamily II metal-dependent hydrolase